jgi:uncharacterized protein YcbK (DUF882 family)
MSIECDNTTPLAGKAGSTLGNDSALFDNLIDVSSLIDDSDPFGSAGLNRNAIIDLTNGLNGLLGASDLTGFDTLKERFDQFPLTFTEIAAFAINNNENVNDLLNGLNNFQEGNGGKNTGSGGGNTLGPYVGYSSKDGGLDGANSNQLTDAFIGGLLGDLDFYYNQNLGASISAGTCGAFGNALMQLLGVFQLLDTLNATLAKIQDLDPKKLAIQLAQKLKIDAIKKKIKDTIKKLVEKIKRQVLKTVNSIIPQLKNMGCASKAFFKKMRKKIDQINEFFSEENIKRIRDEIDTFINNMVANFQRLTLENALMLMYQLCRFTEQLQALLMGDANEVQRIAIVTQNETRALESAGLKQTMKAVENGAVRVAPAERLKKREEVIKKNNEESKKSKVPKDHITDPCPTQEEMEIINKISDAGLGDSITFSSSVVKNKEWQDVDNSVWSKLLRIVKATDAEYEVTNGVKKKTNTTATMGGTSNHIHLTGFAVDISINDKNRKDTIIAASKAGFSGIGVYKTFLHLDVGTRRSRVAGDKGIDISPTEQFAGTDLADIKKIMNKHDSDGHRKVRDEGEEVEGIDLSTIATEDLTEEQTAQYFEQLRSARQQNDSARSFESESIMREVDQAYNSRGLKSIRQMTKEELEEFDKSGKRPKA